KPFKNEACTVDRQIQIMAVKIVRIRYAGYTTYMSFNLYREIMIFQKRFQQHVQIFIRSLFRKMPSHGEIDVFQNKGFSFRNTGDIEVGIVCRWWNNELL